MALGPDNSDIPLQYRRMGLRVSGWFKGGHGGHRFAPDEVLSETTNIDPRLKPRARMNSDNIDPALMLQFRSMGFSHAQEITADSHPELYAGWRELCRRAGFPKTLQLIVTDSKDPNAIDASESEVVMSTGLLKMLTLREVLGVLGHELGHALHDAKNNRRAVIDLVSLGGGVMVGDTVGIAIQQRYTDYGPMMDPKTGQIMVDTKNRAIYTLVDKNWFKRGMLGLARIASVIVGGVIGWVIGHQFSVKPSELAADREGIRLSGDPAALVSAFEKMKAMSTGQPSWKRALRYAWSGYPTFDARIRQINHIAHANPPREPAVYQMVEALSDAPPPPEVVARARREQPGTPNARISNIAESERVIFVPTNSLLH